MARIEIRYSLIPDGFARSVDSKQLEFLRLTRLFCGWGVGRLDVDLVPIRDSHGRPFIPGSTIKGIIREKFLELTVALGIEWERVPSGGEKLHHLYRNEYIDEVFGAPDQPDIRAVFSDLKLSEEGFQLSEEEQKLILTRVSIDRRLKKAKPKHLFKTEYSVVGAFRGQIILWTSPENIEQNPNLTLLLGAIKLLRFVGGHRSTGAGTFYPRIDLVKLWKPDSKGEIIPHENILRNIENF